MPNTATSGSSVRSLPPAALIAGGVVAAVFVLVSLPTFADLFKNWWEDPRYSHGYLVPLFSIYLLWSRRALFQWNAPSWWGVPLIALGVGLCLLGRYLFFFWLNQVALLPLVAGMVLLVGGWRMLRWSASAIAFLAFMIPLPYRLQVSLAMPLQAIGTRASVYALQMLGLVPYSEGNVIFVKGMRLGVEEACSGLGMLVVFFAIATAYAMVSRRPWLDRVVAVLSAIPIAVLSNIIRITITGVLYALVGQETGNKFFHAPAGWLMMLMALGFLSLEMRMLDWLFPQRPEDSERKSRSAIFVPGLGTSLPRDTPGMGVAR
jgi:exosortase